jgi:esterase/lipase
VQDVSFTLDQLAAINKVDPHHRLTGKLDLTRIGTFGVSLGGILAGKACLLDARLKACLIMDAPMSTDVVQKGLQQPCMWITRPIETMRLERERAGGWSEAEIHAHLTSMRSAFEKLPTAGYFVQITDLFHSNLTDIPSWSPLFSVLGVSGPISEQRAHQIINGCSVAFFDRHLKGDPSPLLEGLTRSYPEVKFQTHQP